jgi:hypothetical protein
LLRASKEALKLIQLGACKASPETLKPNFLNLVLSGVPETGIANGSRLN